MPLESSPVKKPSLLEAMVDVDGGVIGTGRISYPKDDDGLFPADFSGTVHLSRLGWTLQACSQDRDPISGFLVSERIGAVLFLPQTFEPVLKRALRYCPPQGISLSIDHEEGSLVPSAEPGERRRQPLSNCTLEVSENADGGVELRFSAALEACFDRPPQSADVRNYWRESGSRVQAVFVIDPITRIVAFGAYRKELLETLRADIPAVRPTTRKAPSLNYAGFLGNELAIGDSGTVYSFFNSDSAIALTPRSGYPRVWLWGLNLDILFGLMVDRGKVEITIREAPGSLEQHHTFAESMAVAPDQKFLEVDFRSEINEQGLILSYRILVKDLELSCHPYRPGWIQDGVRLPWELLIARYPKWLALGRKFA